MRPMTGADPRKAAVFLLSPSPLPNLDLCHALLRPWSGVPSGTLPKLVGQGGYKLLACMPWLMVARQEPLALPSRGEEG